MTKFIKKSNQELLMDLTQEYVELNDKLNKLNDCITFNKPSFSYDDFDLLEQQAVAMSGYLGVLRKRIHMVCHDIKEDEKHAK